LLDPITIERITPGGIPTLQVSPRGAVDPLPTVLLYHGWVGKKENQQIAAEALACAGFRVLAPDLPRHGERGPFPDYGAPEAWNSFWDVVAQAIEEVPLLLRVAGEAPIGVAGNSTGGMVAGGALARYPSMKASVILNSCLCFEWLDRRGGNAPPLEGARLVRLRSFDPEALVEKMAPRPVLLLHGAADTTLPVAGARRFVERARPYYLPHPANLTLTEVPGLDHWVTAGMVGAMRDWFLRHL